jgi:hypothetical protein
MGNNYVSLLLNIERTQTTTEQNCDSNNISDLRWDNFVFVYDINDVW